MSVVRAIQQHSFANVLFSDVVPGNTVKTVDEIDPATPVKWIISIADTANDKENTSEVLARLRGSDTSWNRAGIVGDKNLQFKVDVSTSGTDISLNIVNNESNDLDISVLRMSLLPI